MKYILFALPLLLIFSSLQAQESMLQDVSYPFLEKLVIIAKTEYPKSKSNITRVEMAVTGVRKAKISYLDVLSFSYLFNPASVTPTQSILNGYRFGLVLNIGALLQKPVVIKQAQQELKIAENEKDAYELNLEALVKERYFTYVQRKTILKLLSGSLMDVESMLKDTRYKFEKGEETLENYNRALLMYSNQVQIKITAEGETLIAKGNLEELIGKKLEDVK